MLTCLTVFTTDKQEFNSEFYCGYVSDSEEHDVQESTRLSEMTSQRLVILYLQSWSLVLNSSLILTQAFKRDRYRCLFTGKIDAKSGSKGKVSLPPNTRTTATFASRIFDQSANEGFDDKNIVGILNIFR